MTDKPCWINIGCADDIREGFENVDLPEYDLRWKWVWADSSVDYILARDIIEHLPDKLFTMNEAWRVLKPGGVIDIEVPTTDGNGAFSDPTHTSFWNRRSFLYYESGNIYRERFAKSYGILAAFKVVSEQITETMDGPKLRIQLQAVK